MLEKAAFFQGFGSFQIALNSVKLSPIRAHQLHLDTLHGVWPL
jgi:hypothetical protein